MRKQAISAAFALVVFALVGGMALAEHENTDGHTQCGYATTGNTVGVAVPVVGLRVYAGPNGSEPGTNNGTAAGVCTGNDALPVDGIAEARVSGTCAYVVADGDPSNPPDPTAIDGYARVSLPGCGFTGIGSSGGHHG